MKNKLSKILIASTMLFTLFSFPKMDVKANETEVMPCALVTVIDVDETKTGSEDYGNETINYTVRLYGSYMISNGEVTNIDVNSTVTRTPTGSALTAYVKSITKTVQSNNTLKVVVKIGFKYGLVNINSVDTHTFYV